MKLSSKLSPKAKKALLSAEGGEQVSCLLQIAPSQNVNALRRQVESLGGTIRSWMEETHLLSVDLDASQLNQLVDMDGVIYIETGERYG